TGEQGDAPASRSVGGIELGITFVPEEKQDAPGTESSLREELSSVSQETELPVPSDAGQSLRFAALVPVREYAWESYHSVVNEGGGARVLARQLADALSLCSQPQTFDLFDTEGCRATLTWRHQQDSNTERFIYMRRDLVDKLLA